MGINSLWLVGAVCDIGNESVDSKHDETLDSISGVEKHSGYFETIQPGGGSFRTINLKTKVYDEWNEKIPRF